MMDGGELGDDHRGFGFTNIQQFRNEICTNIGRGFCFRSRDLISCKEDLKWLITRGGFEKLINRSFNSNYLTIWKNIIS